MTQEEKQLLLQDLCARLPYGVKATTTSNGWRDVYVVSGYNDNRIYLDCPVYDEGDEEWLIESIKPYLRPMSSMTEEEKWELVDLCLFYECYCDTDAYSHYGIEIISQYCVDDRLIPENMVSCQAIDWLNSHHFDYRGLIPKGLALPSPEGMYIIK